MINVIIGTRAQLIKIAPVMVELKVRGVDYLFVFTGQHTTTMDDLIDVFKIKRPDLRLYSGREITKIAQVPLWSFRCVLKSLSLRRYFGKGDIALVHGDAYSTILASVIAKLLKMKIGYVEAGLRSFDCFDPFPEEITRVLTSKLADFHFCPGRWAVDNLKGESGVKVDTGMNTLYDTLRLFMKNENRVCVDIPKVSYAVVSIHRFENIFNKEKLGFIVDLLGDVSERIHLVFVLHPATEYNLRKYKLLEALKKNEGIELRSRCDYFKFIKLMAHSEFVITDGGSNQEESYYLGKPCLLFRDKTERLEGLGRNVVLSQFNKRFINHFVDNYVEYKYPFLRVDKYPSRIIVDFLEKWEPR